MVKIVESKEEFEALKTGVPASEVSRADKHKRLLEAYLKEPALKYDGKELIVEVTRVYEGTLEEYSTTRVLIGDVISLNDVPPQVSGAVKTSPSPTTDDMLRIPRHSLPDDAVGYFVAVKIPPVPGAV